MSIIDRVRAMWTAKIREAEERGARWAIEAVAEVAEAGAINALDWNTIQPERDAGQWVTPSEIRLQSAKAICAAKREVTP